MAKKMGKRIYRQATVEEQGKHKRIRELIAEALPDIKQRAQQKLAEAMQHGIALQHTMAVLKAERVKKELSLADIKERTGIERSTLSRLKYNAAANPTIRSAGTLTLSGKRCSSSSPMLMRAKHSVGAAVRGRPALGRRAGASESRQARGSPGALWPPGGRACQSPRFATLTPRS